MRMGYELTMEQQQKLVMTPELKLALKILQLPSMELDQLIQNELEINPILDIKEEIKEEKVSIRDNASDSMQKDIDWKEYLQFQGKSYYIENHEINDDSDMNYDNLITYRSTLKEHLLFQLNLIKLDSETLKIGEFIIESIDDNGYLTLSIEDIVKLLAADSDKVEKALVIVQSFDPIGVGARDLKECLLMQIRVNRNYSKLLEEVITNHLDDIANNRLLNISKKLSITVEEVQKLSDLIKGLEPKPGRAFDDNTELRYVSPDIFIDKIGGEYVISINDYNGSRLTINQDYKNILKTEDKSSEAYNYINNKLSSAMWLIRSIEHRKNTLYNVIQAILEYQMDFFENGVMYLKSMTLKTIADMIEVHESTVSRAVNGKYVQTPRGVFEIKYFFKSGIDSFSGDSVSSESIKKVIRELISQEDSSRPLSDQNIADILSKRGYNISRRTIAKYRDEIGILASSKRKRY